MLLHTFSSPGLGQEQPAVRLQAFLPQIPKHLRAASVKASQVPGFQSLRLVFQGNLKSGDTGCKQRLMVQEYVENILCELICWGI